jgi:coenzyme F420-reducing hydrogenase beta subunit
MSKYDAAIVGVGIGCNYGSVLTYFGLHETLKRFFPNILIVSKINAKLGDVELQDNHALRFAREQYNLSPHYNFDTIKELNALTDLFVLGSDQVFNYGINKNFGKAFYLDFTDDDKKRISYASSFGHAVDYTPPEERVVISNLLKRFDAISVREDDGVKICRDIYGVSAARVADPIVLAGAETFLPLIENARLKETEPFVLTYILDPTPEKREVILYISKRLGLKYVNVLDGFPHLFDRNNELLHLDNTPRDVQAEDLLWLYQNCSYAITDSFHGTLLAALFNKPFISFANKRRGISRMKQLYDVIGHKERLFAEPLRVIEKFEALSTPDFDAVNDALRREREASLAWLKAALEKPAKQATRLADDTAGSRVSEKKTPKQAITSLLPPENCVGCGACVSICPKDALTLMPDVYGYYRCVNDAQKCVLCGLCARVCPALSLPKNANAKNPKLYAFVCADEKLLFAGSSGSAFSLLAKQVFCEGGSVAGAAWRGDFSVEHVIIDSEADLYRLRKSKYMQSCLDGIFREIKAELKKGRFFLFSGCPCQVAGLKAYLGKEYDRLLLVDLLCANAPSAMFFKKYLDDSFGANKVKRYEFRHKEQGWNADCLTLSLSLADGRTLVRRGGAQDAYQSVYHNHTMCPPHCEHCKYQSLPRFGDLTVGDFWGLGKRDAGVDTSKGVSAVLVNNEKGAEFFRRIEADASVCKEVPLEWLGGNGYAVKGRNFVSKGRDAFYKAIQDNSFREAVKLSASSSETAVLPAENRSDSLPNTGSPLDFSSRMSHFTFDGNCFEEHIIDGYTVLTVKAGQSSRGVHAALPLRVAPDMRKKYEIAVRFNIRTDSSAINFHIKNSVDGKFQVVLSCDAENTKGFKSFRGNFVPNAPGYDQIMIGAVHIRGDGAYLAIDSIKILEMGQGM